MGSSSSHVVSSESSSSRSGASSRVNRTKRRLSFLFCGVFTPKSTFKKFEDCPEVSSVNGTKGLSPVDGSQNSSIESPSLFTSEAGNTSSTNENEGSSERDSSVIEEVLVESAPLNDQINRDLEPCTHQPQDSFSRNGMVEGMPFSHSGRDQTSSPVHGFSISHRNLNDPEYNHEAAVGYNDSDIRSLSVVSDSLPQFRYPGNGNAHLTTNSSPGFLGSASDQDLRSGALLQPNLVSLSSNTLSDSTADISRRESRRNSRRQFWDALSRHSFRRHTDSPSIILATGLADELGSRDRWLVAFTGDLHSNGNDHGLDSFSARLRHRNEDRWLLRSEISEMTLVGPNEGGRETAFCASGLHRDGTCSCDSFLRTEESSSFASISRIVLLADALFEVLDEIQHQSLSISLSTLSLPAPETVVDSFPLKDYIVVHNAGNGAVDIQQCHICLADYEERDKLRVLPCNHEYHMHCIDKWLKEVNRICPLCRHNVCEPSEECSPSDM